MRVTGFHLLLTYQCTFECDHCFVWGSPWQSGVMSLAAVDQILQQARQLGSVSSIYFEGGEPFLYYPTLLAAVRQAAGMGFEVGIVSNAYWAVGEADALQALQPFAGLVSDLTLSSDLFHYSQPQAAQVQHAQRAAAQLGIPTGTISIALPAGAASGQIQPGDSGVMFRGRAADRLAPQAAAHPWESFTTCPFEDLVDPGRVHIDPLGNVHLCQGLLLGSLFHIPARQLFETYQPAQHPIAGPLLAGGPAALARCYGLEPQDAAGFADACHFCYETRRKLRHQQPVLLGPDQMYGIMEE